MNTFNQLVKIEELDHEFYTNLYQQKGPFILNIDNCQNQLFYQKCGEWTIKQNVKFVLFMEKYWQAFQGQPHKLLWEEYKKMAKFVGTRNFRQCKSHHQKLTINFGSFSNILAFFKTNKYFEIIFEQQSRNIQKSSNKSSQNIIATAPPQQYPKLKNKKTQKLIPQYQLKTSDEYQVQISSKTSIDYKSFQKYQINLDKKQQWIQCHKLFIQWTFKLQSLMFGSF